MWPIVVRNGLKRPFTLLKRRFTRASFRKLEAVFARKVIEGNGIGKRPPPGTSIPNEGKELGAIMAGGSRGERRNTAVANEMRQTVGPEKNSGHITKYNNRPAGRPPANRYDDVMRVTLHVWRQKNSTDPGRMATYEVADVSPDMSFLEMLDQLNERLVREGQEPVAFDHDCREGICGSCAMMIDGLAHGPERATTACQLHMRSFADGAEITVEPWRARAFPVVKDLVTDRTAFDRIIQAGGFVGVNTGGAPDGNAIPVAKADQERAMDAAACIGCGACVAACPNASAMLFLAAKVGHLGSLPQGQPERTERVRSMVASHDREGFGHCTNINECEAACPKEISVEFIAQLNRDTIGSAASAVVRG
jgi:succinate dehydrogenase / fumarate reductase iron-sulfur subunit